MDTTLREWRMINVFFPYYQCGDVQRQLEIDLCLQKNIDNEHIDRLLVMIDDGSDFTITNSKVTLIRLDKRPTYKYWLEKTHELTLTGISILCNSDIYFDDSLIEVKKVMCQKQSFIALSRWELLGGEITMHPNPHWSQDVWAVRCDDEYTDEMLHQLAFPMGVPRCDNKIAYLFAIYGWKVFNPCAVLKSMHVHETQLRTYHKKLDDRIIGAAAHVFPNDDPYAQAELELTVWVKRSNQLKKVGINKTLERWEREVHEEASSQKDTLSKYNAAQPDDLLAAMETGKTIYQKGAHFTIYESATGFYFRNVFDSKKLLTVPKITKSTLSDIDKVAGLIPPVINTYVDEIQLKGLSKDHSNFWQYPCATEKQAFENHLGINPGEHVSDNNTINVYLPLPWATYIDRKSFPEVYIKKIKLLIAQYKQLANEHKLILKIHTVCQHIHWVRMLEVANDVGVTDLHISHKNSKSENVQKEVGHSFTLHGWSLIAVNYVIPERCEGMERKPIKDKKLLASFIGAHMPHYLDDSRIRLFEAAKDSGRSDLLVDLGKEWHFNKVVYEEQVLSKEIETHHIHEHQQKTFRYNTILSDSVFSLCPIGAGPNTLRFWESIAVGSIPIVFDDDLSIFSEKNAAKQLIDNIVVWKNGINGELFKFISEISADAIQQMSENLIEYYESISRLHTLGCTRIDKVSAASPSNSEQNLKVLYVGASVTAQKNGYRPALNKLFKQKKFNVIEQVIATGATGSMFGLCNLSTLKSTSRFDLVVYEYSTGDLNIGLTPLERVEDVVEQSLEYLKQISSEVILVNNYRSDYEGGTGDFVRDLHKSAAIKQNVPIIDNYQFFEKLRKETKEKDWKEIYRDNVHTGELGSNQVATLILDGVLKNIDLSKGTPNFKNGQYKQCAEFKELNFNGKLLNKYTYPSSGQVFSFRTIEFNEVASFNLLGELWGVVSIVGPQSGWLVIKADGVEIQKFCQFDAHCYYQRIQPRQFIRKFKEFTNITIELINDNIDFNKVKESHVGHQLPRTINLSCLMGKDIEINNLKIMKKEDRK